MCTICDTLRNDADNGDECVECGAVYSDPTPRVKWIPPADLVAKVQAHAQKSSAPSRSVRNRHINGFSAGGLTQGRRGR